MGGAQAGDSKSRGGRTPGGRAQAVHRLRVGVVLGGGVDEARVVVGRRDRAGR